MTTMRAIVVITSSSNGRELSRRSPAPVQAVGDVKPDQWDYYGIRPSPLLATVWAGSYVVVSRADDPPDRCAR
jgi:hypothetical protein